MVRVKRLYHHFLGWASDQRSTLSLPYAGVFIWLVDFAFLSADLLFPEKIYAGLRLICRRKGRGLEDQELEFLRPIFRDSVDYGRVKVCKDMPQFIQKWAHAFVLFNTINYGRDLSDDVLVHEMVHIWQYQRYGSAYIGRALLAQNSKEGYNYGGVEQLFAGMAVGRHLLSFNFEQQGDIVQDAYLQSKGIRGINNRMYSAVYQYYTSQLEY